MSEKKILLATKHEAFAQAMVYELERIGFHCFHATSCEMALRHYKTVYPTVLLTDYDLPGIGGPELIKQLIKLYGKIKTVGISNSFYTYMLEDLTKAGACGYVWRYMRSEDLLLVLESIANGNDFLPDAPFNYTILRRTTSL